MDNERTSDRPALRVVVVGFLLQASLLGGLLSEFCGLELSAVCDSPSQVCAEPLASAPDLLLLDSLAAGDSWQAWATDLAHRLPSARLILLNWDDSLGALPQRHSHWLLAALRRGQTWDDLVAVVSSWQERCGLRSPTLATLSLQRLSPREIKVFQALGRGFHNKAIAQRLGLSLATVETYRKSLSAKLGLSGSELVRAAVLHRCARGGDQAPRSGREPTPIRLAESG